MRPVSAGTAPTTSSIQLLLAYVADLELEVDRLRKQHRFVCDEVQQGILRVRSICIEQSQDGNARPAIDEIRAIATELASMLRDLVDRPGYHPAHDQVVALAVRPLIEQVFRMQQRLTGAFGVVLRLNLESEHVEWFPARLRHILDNLLGNSMKFRDGSKEESWVEVGLRVAPDAYEIRVSDNGVGLTDGALPHVFDLLYRAAPTRDAGLGVGLPIVKKLVEQSGGSLTVDSGTGKGTVVVAIVPRYDMDDFLT